jgi:CRISPR/Cas system-associated exonuclease Cas4 (RecB family)
MDAHYLYSEAPSKLDKVHTGAAKKITTAFVVDFKTGKNKPEHFMQRELYALGALHVYADIAKVVVEHWYLDSAQVETSVFYRDQLEALKQLWAKRTKAMLHDKRFAPRPSNACRWCHFRKENGGPCKF